jgi:hypothetical protein
MSVEEIKIGNQAYVRWSETRYFSSAVYYISKWQNAGWSFVKRETTSPPSYDAVVTFAQVTKAGVNRPRTLDEPEPEEIKAPDRPRSDCVLM